MKKLEVVQVSLGGGPMAYEYSKYLEDLGFKARGRFAYLGAVPQEGKQFFVHYEEPKAGEKGAFLLVRKAEPKDIAIDMGEASESHTHEGLGTLTFYGGDWSFHCKKPD